MAGAMRKMAVYLGLVEDEDEHYDEVDTEQQPEPQFVRRYAADDPRVEQRPAVVRGSARSAEAPRAGAATATAVAPARQSYRITTVQPRTYNEARQIGEYFREDVPVIMNLTEMDDHDAKRLVDFAAGLIFGLRGSIERVTNKVFLLSPRDIEVTAEDKALIAEGGFFNQS